MTNHKTLMATGLVLAVLVAACGSTGVGTGGPAGPTATTQPTPAATPHADGPRQAAVDTLALARADWEAQGLDTYTYRLTRQCFCDPAAIGPWTVTVEDDMVTAVTAEDGSDVTLSGGVFEFGTIEDLHDTIAMMLESPDAGFPSGSFDVQGLPQALFVDPEPTMADEEATYTAELVDDGDTGPDQPADGGAASGSMLEPLSESALWATGTGVDPSGAFTATPVCGPTDAVLGYDLTGTFTTTEPLVEAAPRLQGLGLDVIEGEGTVTATGTSSTDAPVTITLDGATATVQLQLETIPGGYDIPIDRPCG